MAVGFVTYTASGQLLGMEVMTELGRDRHTDVQQVRIRHVAKCKQRLDSLGYASGEYFDTAG